MPNFRNLISSDALKNIRIGFTLNTKDPLIKDFIEKLHGSIIKRLEKISIRNVDDWCLENRIFKIYCDDKYISPQSCAEKLNALYNCYDLTGNDVIKIFTYRGVKTRPERMDILKLVEYKVEAFIKELRNSGLIPEEKKSDLPTAMAYAIMPSQRTSRITEQLSEQNIDPSLIKTNSRVSPYEMRFRDAERKLNKILGASTQIVEDGKNHQIQIILPNETELLRVLTNIETALTNSTNDAVEVEDTTRAEKLAALRKFSTEGIVN